MNDESKKRLVNLLPDLVDEVNPEYDFSSIGLKPYSGSTFLPYFVVYRFLNFGLFIVLVDVLNLIRVFDYGYRFEFYN